MKVCFKSFAAGCIISTIGIATVFAAGGIKSAAFNANKVILDGKELDLQGQQMVSVVLEGDKNASNYMPVRGVLGAMGYTVSWDGLKSAVVVESPKTVTAPAISSVKENHVGETVIYSKPPTAKALEGFWTGKQENGADVQYSFGKDGITRVYTLKDGAVNYMAGTFKVNGNKVDFSYTNGVAKGANFDNGPMEMTEDIGVSDDGNKISISLTDQDTTYVLILTKADTPIELKGTTVPSITDLDGTWTAEENDVKASYTFNGNDVTLVIDEGTEIIIFKGTATIPNVSGHKYAHIYFKYADVTSNNQKIGIAAVEMDYFIGTNGNNLIITDGINSSIFTKK